MARNTSRKGLVVLVASSLRTALRPGSAGLVERAAAVPRMVQAMLRGQYRGTTLGHLLLLAGAAAYIVSPVDLMPEALFGVLGIGDDAMVVTWLVAALVHDTEDFLEWEQTVGKAPAGGRTAGSAGPQDMSADEWRRTVRSQVVG